MRFKHNLAALAVLALAGTTFLADAQATKPATPAAEPAAHADHKTQTLIVNKSPTCSCCGRWVEHMRAAGFEVEVRNFPERHALHALKERLGVPASKRSCHTAQIGGYFIEGHVPAEDVKRLLAEHPDARGLTVPGMPRGTPGMEVPDGSVDPYTVELVANDSSTTPFAKHGQ